jgi:hypothetical protein
MNMAMIGMTDPRRFTVMIEAAAVVRHCGRTGHQRGDQGTHNSNAFHIEAPAIHVISTWGARCRRALSGSVNGLFRNSSFSRTRAG